MKKLAWTVMGSVLLSTIPVTASAQTSSPASICEALKNQWRDVEYDLAEAYAEGSSDNSAPRAAVRAGESTNRLLVADIILTLMASHKCPPPKRAPSELNYANGALGCRIERMKGELSPSECDRSTWKPMFEDD